MLSNRYIKYLSNKTKDESFVDRLKIKFRPLIFPIEELLEELDESDTLFDIGCGSGQFSLLAVHFRNVKQVYGIEIKEELVNNANNLFEKHAKETNYSFMQYNGKDFPVEIKKSSKVFLNDVLHHVPEEAQIEFLKSIYNSMDKGATFILKDIDASSFFVYFNKLHDLIFAREIGKELTLKKAKQVLSNIGFEILKTERKNIYVYPHYTIICKK